MLDGQPNQGWQLCFALYLHASMSDFRLYDGSDLSIDEIVGACCFGFCQAPGVYLLDCFCSGIQFYVLWSLYLCLISFLYLDLYVLGDNSWIN